MISGTHKNLLTSLVFAATMVGTRSSNGGKTCSNIAHRTPPESKIRKATKTKAKPSLIRSEPNIFQKYAFPTPTLSLSTNRATTTVAFSSISHPSIESSKYFPKHPPNTISAALKSNSRKTESRQFSTPIGHDNHDTKRPRSKPITTVNNAPRTESFGAISADSTKVHTLILGTHPSIKSLSEKQYFGHPMNAFWWIAGDCLGFRRAAGLSVKNTPYKFTSNLRYDESHILPYDKQVQKLTSNGFALWDIVKSCEREGSLDSAIQREEPNDIRAFCEEHPGIERIVFANGVGGCKMFLRHYKEWWKEEGELMPERDDHSLKAFSAFKERKNGRIKCVAALAVSPAAAGSSYEDKRDNWEAHCYKPGLEVNLRLQQMQRKESSIFLE